MSSVKVSGMEGRGTDVFLRSLSDCLKCIAWKGRAIVVGFAGGEIEKVRMHTSILTVPVIYRAFCLHSSSP